MNDAYFGNETFWETKVYTNMYQIFIILGESFSDVGQHESKSLSQSFTQINALIQYIDINYSEELSTEQAATFTGFSKYHFLRLFKQHTGYTFHDYLNMKRIRVAEELLTTDMQVTDIAFHTGFNNLPSFCRTFKKYTNYSPSEYKKLRISEELKTHKIN
jgi:AraC-like DNA-binding protein